MVPMEGQGTVIPNERTALMRHQRLEATAIYTTPSALGVSARQVAYQMQSVYVLFFKRPKQ